MPALTPRFHFVAHRLLSLLVLLAMFASLLAPMSVAAAPNVRIVYVKQDAADDNSGDTWDTARSLVAALEDSVAGDEIWVAAGVHFPRPIDESFSFQLRNGVAVYGGFAGNETKREQRNPVSHVSVLSGDIDNNDTNKTPTGVITDTADIVGINSFNVVTGSDTDSTAVLDGFTITGGNATNPGINPCAGCGAGLLMVNGSATLANLIFSGNGAYTGGGGLHLYNSSPTLTNVTFIGNSAKVGGGMYNNVSSNPELTNVTFSSNKADYGGGLYDDGSNFMLTNVTFSGNQAGYGGGIYNDGSNPILTNVTVERNIGTFDGGGVYNEGANPILTIVTFSGNKVGFKGGGMYNDHSIPTLNNVLFLGNQAGDDGGGMYTDGGDPLLNGVTFSGNRAADDGGGMYNSGRNPILTNVIFSGNRSLANGGGMYMLNSEPILTNVTFSGNKAQFNGGGIATDNSVFQAQNTVVWKNTPDSIRDIDDSNLHFRYSLLEGDNPFGTGNLDGTDSANAPVFVHDVNCGVNGCTDDPATLTEDESADDDYGDLRLQPTSPAVDAGDNAADLNYDRPGTATIASIPNDAAGQPRIVAVKALPPTVDMGAYETAAVHPHADAGGLYSVDEGSALALSGAASSDDGSIITYAWDCTADGTIDASAATPTGNSCTYSDDGSYTLRLTVTDNVSTSASATSTVTVANVAPTYTPTSNQSTFAANAKFFVLGSFADPGAEGSWPVTIDWGDNSPLTHFNANAVGGLPAKSHTYATPATYNVLVTVNDGEASDDGGFEVKVNPPAPGAPAVTAPADQAATAGIDKSLALGSFTDPGSSGPWQVSVNWGDSSTATQFDAGTAGTLPAKPHTYSAADTYDVVVTVSDGALSTSASFRVTASAESDTGSVTGVVFADANANGAQESGELGVGGAKMTLKTAGAVSGASADLTRTTTSDANGRYRFDNVPAGSYTLNIAAPAGYATLGAVEVPLTVQRGKTTTAATFTLQLDGADSGSVFLPVIHP